MLQGFPCPRRCRAGLCSFRHDPACTARSLPRSRFFAGSFGADTRLIIPYCTDPQNRKNVFRIRCFHVLPLSEGQIKTLETV